MSVELYPKLLRSGDLTPDNLNDVDDICEEIQAACKGFGTDENRLLKAMGSQTPNQRCKVPLLYKQKFDQDLLDEIKSEVGDKPFGEALQYLALDPASAECLMLHKATASIGTNELLVFTILGGRTNKDIEILKKKYFDMYDKDLGSVLSSELGGDLELLITNILQASQQEYDPSYHTDEKMEEDCRHLNEEGIARWGTDEKGLFKILCAEPPQYLEQMESRYAELYGYTLSKAIEKELGGQARDAALFMLGMNVKPYEEVAKLIHKACKGFGTNEHLLISSLIRYQPIMREVASAHQELFNDTIENAIKKETSSDFETLLLEVLTTGEQ